MNYEKNLWKEHKGGKLNHLIKWEIVTRAQEDGGLHLRGLKAGNLALLGKWGWHFSDEDNSLWCQVVKSMVEVCSIGTQMERLVSAYVAHGSTSLYHG